MLQNVTRDIKFCRLFCTHEWIYCSHKMKNLPRILLHKVSYMEIIYTLHNRTWNQLCLKKVSRLSYFRVLSYSVNGKRLMIVYVTKPKSFPHSTAQVFLGKSNMKLLTCKKPKYPLANSQKPVPVLSNLPLLALLRSSSWVEIKIWVI
jgi:hypothetical protein